MRNVLLFIVTVAVIFSCATAENSQEQVGAETLKLHEYVPAADTQVIPEEEFSDSLLVGRREMNKIELRRYVGENPYVLLSCFSKRNGGWVETQKFNFLQGHVICDVRLVDMNADGYTDFTYMPESAARGANELRKLFIYRPAVDSFIYVRSSEDHPNLFYDSSVNSIIDSRFYGETIRTALLRLDGDTLLEVSGKISTPDSTLKFIVDKNGNEKIISRKKNKERGYDY